MAIPTHDTDGLLAGRLATALGLSQPTVSHHMRIMVEEGLLEREQQGRVVWWVRAVRDDITRRVRGLLNDIQKSASTVNDN